MTNTGVKNTQTICPEYAMTRSVPGFYWTDHYMTFCNQSFNSSSLNVDIEKAKSGMHDTRVMERFQTNRAATFFHESFHLHYTVGNLIIRDNPDGVGEDYEGISAAGPVANLTEKRNAGAATNRVGIPFHGPPAPFRKAVAPAAGARGATDPTDSSSESFAGDWRIFIGSNYTQVTMGDQLGQAAHGRAETTRASNARYLLSDGMTPTTIVDIAYSLRQVLCSDRCELPVGITDDNARVTPTNDGKCCEINVAMPNSVEIYLYRKTQARGFQAQECWDYTQPIFETCRIRGPNASEGWINGLHMLQYYQGGLRTMNDAQSHAVKARHPLDPAWTL